MSVIPWAKRRFKLLFLPLALTFGLIVPTHADALLPCATWVTVSNSAKTYSTCNWTWINYLWGSTGTCLQYVSWKRTKNYIWYNLVEYKKVRVYLENEVRSITKTCIGYFCTTSTSIVWGSHTSTLQSEYLVWASSWGGDYYYCSS